MKFRVLMLLMLALSVGIVPVVAQDEEACADGVLIVHDLGETCVPAGVERVVTIEHSMTEAVVTLGVQPVGVTEIELYNSLVNLSIPLSEDAVDVGSRREPNLEVIAGLNPDLIVAASWRIAAIYDQLSAIAPTITFSGSDSLAVMEEFFTTIAVALDREEEAELILADMHAYFVEASEIIAESDIAPEFVLTQTWFIDDVATFRLYTDDAFPVEILNLIGLENQFESDLAVDGLVTVGIEPLGEITDVNFLMLTDEASAPRYGDSPLWNSLDFVKNERLYRLNNDLWLFGGPLSAQRFANAALIALGLVEPEVEEVAPEATPEATAEAAEG